jgi:hypothetical protein
MISPDVIAVLERGAIALFRLPQLEVSEPSLLRICKLALPPLRRKMQYCYNAFRSYYQERRSGSTQTHASYQRLPFSNDWMQGIIPLSLSIHSPETSHTVSYSLVLSRKALFTAAERTSKLFKRTDRVPWCEWGPRASQLFSEPSAFLPMPCTGQRRIWWDNFAPRMLTMHDYNAFRARRAHSKIPEDTIPVNDSSDVKYERHTIRVRVGPTSIQSNECFAEDIISELPYREIELGPFPADLGDLVAIGEQLLVFEHEPVVSSVL